ncbi:histidine permease [Colletotrichum orchidophilum]|uniref:Histidine permease n=1 Tax=Colletotrichum orchidophilum TaxID=1209926 RepID=A0A1G4BNG8_9PEZI|nr:histidine permease [Colletotrichum orchidophilum]OHF02954.1 histidine permease [Colletotrichum orchidophilum]
MIWFIIFFITLASCSPFLQPLVQERGSALSCLGYRGAPAGLPGFIIDLRQQIEAHVYNGDDIPPIEQIPLSSWAGSDQDHHFAYRAWRTTPAEGTALFEVTLEVQVTGSANVFVEFGAQSARVDDDPGLSHVTNGLANGSGSNRIPRRTAYSLQIGIIHQNITTAWPEIGVSI